MYILHCLTESHLIILQCLHYWLLTENLCSFNILCGKDLGRIREVLVVVNGKNSGSYAQEFVVAAISIDADSVS